MKAKSDQNFSLIAIDHCVQFEFKLANPINFLSQGALSDQRIVFIIDLITTSFIVTLNDFVEPAYLHIFILLSSSLQDRINFINLFFLSSCQDFYVLLYPGVHFVNLLQIVKEKRLMFGIFVRFGVLKEVVGG